MAQIEEYQHVEIVIELDKGHSVEAVADKFGVSRQFVRKLAIEAGLLTLQKKRKKPGKKQLFAEDHEKIIERVEEGEELESIAIDFNISVHTIRQLCKREGVAIPRSLHHLKESEQAEIRELLEENEPIEEIARAYNLAFSTVEQLQEAEYKQLDLTVLGFLYEILIENPEATPRLLKKLAKKEGFDISEQAILSYQNRLNALRGE